MHALVLAFDKDAGSYGVYRQLVWHLYPAPLNISNQFMRITLIACCSEKHAVVRSPARLVYASDLFKKSLAWAERFGGTPYVLSAKHGLIGLDEEIAPYDMTLRDLNKAGRIKWAQKTFHALQKAIQPGDEVFVLAGRLYREHLIEPLTSFGCVVSVPMQGLGIGQQKKWLRQSINGSDYAASV